MIKPIKPRFTSNDGHAVGLQNLDAIAAGPTRAKVLVRVFLAAQQTARVRANAG
jgi:hypothetical protein